MVSSLGIVLSVLDGVLVVLDGALVLPDGVLVVEVPDVPGDVLVSVDGLVLGVVVVVLWLGVVVVVVLWLGVLGVVWLDVCANAKPMAPANAVMPAAMLRLFGNLLMKRFSW